MSINTLLRPFISHWGAIYWAIMNHYRRINLERKEIISKLYPILICLSLHPFVLESTINALSQAFICLCELTFVWRIAYLCMKDWSGGGPGGGTCFLNFDKVLIEVFICIFVYINRNIHFSSIACVIMNILIHGCNYFIYVLECKMLYYILILYIYHACIFFFIKGNI